MQALSCHGDVVATAPHFAGAATNFAQIDHLAERQTTITNSLSHLTLPRRPLTGDDLVTKFATTRLSWRERLSETRHVDARTLNCVWLGHAFTHMARFAGRR